VGGSAVRRKVQSIVVSLLLILVTFAAFSFIFRYTPSASGVTLYVGGVGPGNFSTIQGAIDAANPRDTVFVYSGTYNENIVVDITLNLTGEDRDTTTIHGDNSGSVVDVNADWVNITGFSLMGSSPFIREDIKLNNVNNCTIVNNNLSSNAWGIYLDLSSANILKGNIVSNGCGIHLTSSDNNNISNNIITPSQTRFGIHVLYSFNNTILGNNITAGGLYLNGDQLSHYNSHKIPPTNVINEEPLYYYKDESGIIIDGIPVGQIILSNCSNMNIENLEINKTVFGIHIAYSTNIRIKGNNASENWGGIGLINSSECEIIENYVSFSGSGIYLQFSFNNDIWDNNVSIQSRGINLDGSSNNSIMNNNVSYTGIGFDLYNSYDNSIQGNIAYRNSLGIRIWHYSNNMVKNNNLSWNENGIMVRESGNNIIKSNNVLSSFIRGIIFESSSNNLVKNNNITSNDWGFYLESSSNNRIYHNNIINNTNQAYDDGNDNFWNDTYPSGGNYWSDYNGTDLNSTPTQDIPPPDGIGDTPYVIDPDSRDNYPLMGPYIQSSPPLLPPILHINVSSDGKDIVLNWEPQTIQDFDPYLIYRSTDPTSFNFSTPWVNTLSDTESGEPTPIPDRMTWNDTNAAYPGNVTNYEEQYYYVMRAFNGNGEISATSRTVGKWTKSFPEGISTFSLPLEPLEPLDTDYYTSSMNADYIKYVDSVSHTWRLHEYGDMSTNNTIMKLGEGYEVKFVSQTNFTFTGMPGAMISFDNDTGFKGFDTNSDSKNLSVSIEPGGNVTLTWQEPVSMGVGGWYEIFYTHERDGFYGILGEDYFFTRTNVNFGNNTAIHINAQALNPGKRLYYMVVPFNALGVRGTGTYSIGIWTEEYLSEYDTIGVPLKIGGNHTADWYCDNIPDTVGINFFRHDYGMWFWHSKTMPQGAFDTIIKMTEGYQISTSAVTKYTFIGI
jgi:parallel beta-helix repeat protein